MCKKTLNQKQPGIKVLVLNATARSGLVVIQSLAKNGFTVIGADDRCLPFDLHSRYTIPYFTLPNAKDPLFMPRLKGLLKQQKPDVLFQQFCAEPVSMHREEIEKYTNILVPDYDGFSAANDNRRTLEDCARLGIGCPRLLSFDQALKKLETNSGGGSQPRVVLKPRSDFGGSKGVCMVNDPDSLIRAREMVERKYGPAVITEYIPGNAQSMRAVNLVLDKKSNLAAFFTFKKVREFPVSGGLSALGVSTYEPELVDTILPLLKQWRWQGPADVEFKIDSRDNQPKLIEINPRISGNLGFAINCGVDFASISASLAIGADASGEQFPSYGIGLKTLNLTYYIKSVLSEIKGGNGKARLPARVISELRGKRVRNNGEISDPLPLMGKALLELKSKFLHI